MEWQSIFKHFALYGVLMSWVFGYWLSKRTSHLDVKTTSELATYSKNEYQIFGIGVSVAGALLFICTFGYMSKSLDIPGIYYPLYIFTFALQQITAWVPDTKGIKHKVHYFSAWIMSYLLLSLGALLLVSDVPIWFQVFGLFVLVLMSATGTYAGRPGGTKKQFLRSQQLYFVLFQILILARIYV